MMPSRRGPILFTEVDRQMFFAAIRAMREIYHDVTRRAPMAAEDYRAAMRVMLALDDATELLTGDRATLRKNSHAGAAPSSTTPRRPGTPGSEDEQGRASSTGRQVTHPLKLRPIRGSHAPVLSDHDAITNYDVGGLPPEQTASIRVGSNEQWQVRRKVDDVSIEWAARYDTPELALAALQAVIDTEATACRLCRGTRWMCEDHPDKWFNHDRCKAAGVPCPACNRSEPPDMPPDYDSVRNVS